MTITLPPRLPDTLYGCKHSFILQGYKMTGSCPECIEKNKTMPGYCCVLCALGLTKASDNVITDPFDGVTHIDLTKEAL